MPCASQATLRLYLLAVPPRYHQWHAPNPNRGPSTPRRPVVLCGVRHPVGVRRRATGAARRPDQWRTPGGRELAAAYLLPLAEAALGPRCNGWPTRLVAVPGQRLTVSSRAEES